MSPQDMNDLMAAVQSLVVSIAVVIGGVWSLFTFNALAARRRALAEVADLEARAERQPVGTLSVATTQLVLPGSREICLRVDVEIANVGNRNLTLHFDRSSVAVTECFTSGESVVPLGTTLVPVDFTATDDAERLELRSKVFVLAGGSGHFSVVASLPHPGLYHVAVQGRLSDDVAPDLPVSHLADGTAAQKFLEDDTFAVLLPLTDKGKLSANHPVVPQTLAKVVFELENAIAELWTVKVKSSDPSADGTGLDEFIEEIENLRADIVYNSNHDANCIVAFCDRASERYTHDELSVVDVPTIRRVALQAAAATGEEPRRPTLV